MLDMQLMNDLRRIDLNLLVILDALLSEQHVTRAAERVHLSQPAFSRSVQAAEAELGLKLFDRGSVEVNCTAAGAFVIERARRLLFESRCLARDASLYRERQLGDVSFGVGPFPAATLLPQLMVELRTRFAGINSRVEVNNWKYLVEHLRNEELDFFVSDVRDVQADADLLIMSIGRQHASFYVRRKHPLLARRSVKAAAIVPFGIASVRLPAQIRALLRQLLDLGPNAPLPLAVECDDVHLLKQIALATDTVLASTHVAVQEEIHNGQLELLRVSDAPPLYSEMGIVSLKGRSHSPMAEFAVNYLAALAARQRGRAQAPAQRRRQGTIPA